MNSAENYALFMLANYVQRVKGSQPHKFQVRLDPLAPLSAQTIHTTNAENVYGPFNYKQYSYASRDGDAVANTTISSLPLAAAY